MCGPIMSFSCIVLPCILVLMSPQMYIGVMSGNGSMCSASCFQNSSLASLFCSFWHGVYTPKNTNGIGAAEMWISMILSVCCFRHVINGRIQGATTTPTPVAFASDEEKKNV